MDLAQPTPETIWKVKTMIKEEACMKFYDENELLYLETGASRVGLATELLQEGEGMICLRDAAPDNGVLIYKLILSIAMTCYSSIGREH